ncbi:D-inositol-3-phosphate glycosyltransferase [compost metagenome]
MRSSAFPSPPPPALVPPTALDAPRPLRTATVLPSGCAFAGATPNAMETVIRTLVAATSGQEVRIFCDEGARDHGLSSVLPRRPDDQRRTLLGGLRAFQPDLVECHQQVEQAMFLARSMPEARHVLYQHNALKAPRHPLDVWRNAARYKALDGFIFVSATERAAFARAYPALADRAWAAPNPIDTEPWLASPDQRDPVIAFSGPATPEEGLALVCAALPSILDRHPEWRAVLMLGDWMRHQRWATPHVAALRPYESRVTVLHSPPLSEVQRQMKTAAIALTPSMSDEPWGLAAVQAHAAGAALITSGRDGLRAASGPHALYLNDLTPRTLISAIEELIAQPDRRVALARAAQRHVIEVHAPRLRASELLTIRRAILAGRRLTTKPPTA